MSKKVVASIQYIESVLLRGIVTFFLRPAVYGASNLEKLTRITHENANSVVMIANHINAYDPLYISAIVSGITGKQLYPVWLPAKKRFFDNWLKRALMSYHGCLPVGIGKDEDSLKSLKVVIEKIRAGDTICVFPEGQVSPDGNMGKDMGFVTFIARRSSIIVQPVFLTGISGFKADWKEILLRKRQLSVYFGEPVCIERESSVDSIALITQAMVKE